MMVVIATIITIVEYTSPVNIPEDTPTPATIRPTSPLDIIPTPTRIPFARSLRKSHAGSPQPKYFVTIATAMRIPDSPSISRFTVLKSTCAPIMAKNRWGKYQRKSVKKTKRKTAPKRKIVKRKAAPKRKTQTRKIKRKPTTRKAPSRKAPKRTKSKTTAKRTVRRKSNTRTSKKRR